MAAGVASQDNVLTPPKSRSKETSVTMRENNPGLGWKMKGTSTSLPTMDSEEATATAILQQNWRGGKLSGRNGENTQDLGDHMRPYFYGVLLFLQ